jgi:hypothetical protein
MGTMGAIAGNSGAVLPAAPRDDGSHLLTGGLFRHLANRWLHHCAEKVEQDTRWLSRDGVLADFARAAHG